MSKEFDLGDMMAKEFMPDMWIVNDVNRLKKHNVDIIIGYIHFDSELLKCTHPGCDSICTVNIELPMSTTVPLVKDAEYAGAGKITMTYESALTELDMEDFLGLLEAGKSMLLWNLETDVMGVLSNTKA